MNRKVLLILPILMQPVTGWGQESLRVEAPRPILAAIQILEKRYGWIVNYEDPPYTGPGEVVDMTPPSYDGPGRIIVPRSCRLEIRYPVSPSSGRPESIESVLQMLIEDHARRDNIGRFRIRKFGDQICVIPIDGSILDAPIAMPSKTRTLKEAIEEMVRTLTRATGIRIRGPEPSPPNPARFEIGASGEPARSVLLRLFSMAPDARYSWTLLHDPTTGYILRIGIRPQ
jgi:hypothetical protein